MVSMSRLTIENRIPSCYVAQDVHYISRVTRDMRRTAGFNLLELIAGHGPYVVEVEEGMSTDGAEHRMQCAVHLTRVRTREIEMPPFCPPEPKTLGSRIRRWFDAAFPEVVYDGP